MSETSPPSQASEGEPFPPARLKEAAPQRRRCLQPRRRGLLVLLGENPFLAIATFVHVIFVIGLYPYVVQEEAEEPEPEHVLPPVGMTSLENQAQEAEEESEDEAGGSLDPLPQVPANPNLEPREESEQQPEPAEQASSPEPRERTLFDPDRTQAAPSYAPDPSEALSDLMSGERLEGSEGGSISGGRFSLRNERGRALGTREHGGNEGSESAVDAGLRWLAHHQYQATFDVELLTPESHEVKQVELGYWRPHGFHHDARDLRTGESIRADFQRGALATTDTYTVGNTGLALLAFLGAGHTPEAGEYTEEVSRAVRWLLLQQAPSGLFGHLNIRNRHLRLDRRHRGAFIPSEQDYGRPNIYNHSLAVAALAECLAMTGDEALRPVVRAGVAYLVGSQNRNGGWDYHPTVERNDTSITTWVLLALRAADAAGIEVPRTTYLRIIHHFKRLTPADGRTYYNDRLEHLMGSGDARHRGNTGQGVGMIASSALTRLMLGAPRDDEMLNRQLSLIAAEPPDTRQRHDERLRPNLTNPTQNYYAWYMGTLALFLHGGSEWSRWNSVARNTIVRSQSRSGQARGSWDSESRFAWAGGRIYSTAIAVLTLQVYYRYSADHLRAEGRLYERFWDDDELYGVLGDQMRASRTFLNR